MLEPSYLAKTTQAFLQERKNELHKILVQLHKEDMRLYQAHFTFLNNDQTFEANETMKIKQHVSRSIKALEQAIAHLTTLLKPAKRPKNSLQPDYKALQNKFCLRNPYPIHTDKEEN